MRERSSKQPADLNMLAESIVTKATGQVAQPATPKNPDAVRLGRRGGLKGGKARAAKLTPEQRADIARRAAQARWSREGK